MEIFISYFQEQSWHHACEDKVLIITDTLPTVLEQFFVFFLILNTYWSVQVEVVDK